MWCWWWWWIPNSLYSSAFSLHGAVLTKTSKLVVILSCLDLWSELNLAATSYGGEWIGSTRQGISFTNFTELLQASTEIQELTFMQTVLLGWWPLAQAQNMSMRWAMSTIQPSPGTLPPPFPQDHHAAFTDPAPGSTSREAWHRETSRGNT